MQSIRTTPIYKKIFQLMAKAIKITIDDIKEIVMESVTEIQNYQRNVQNAQNVFLKGKSGYNGILQRTHNQL